MALLQISEPGQSPDPHQRRLAVGIDLGTTHSLVAAVRHGVAECLPDAQGRVLLPSAVRYAADGQRQLGHAALAGAPIKYRVVAATFDAALRVVRSQLAIAILPAELSAPYVEAFALKVTPLSDPWARRRFAICCRDEQALKPAARLLIEHLVASAQAA